jgi:hypothetical protein
MTDAQRFKITGGFFALAVVDTAAVGYADDWQTPGGLPIEDVGLADYADADAQWSCQVQTMTIDPSANTNDETVDATWCSPSKVLPNPGETSFAINGTGIADAHVAESLQAFLYLHDTDEAYFYMGLAGEGAPPAAAGRCRIIAANFGGPGSTTLTITIGALPLSRRYDLWHGVTPGTVIEGLTNTERPGVITVAVAAAAATVDVDADDELVDA